MEPSPLVILSHVAHVAVIDGFLPAARRLGLPVVIVTDHRLEHLEALSLREDAPEAILACDVFNPLSVIDTLHGAGIRPCAVFSNSDHLQTSTALVAAAFGLPGKDWRLCYAAKNKAAMRARLAERGLPSPWFLELAPHATLPSALPWPIVAKPREGVASMDVARCDSLPALQAHLAAFWQRHPERSVLLESHLEGPLFTLETLGDGQQIDAIGGFDVSLSPPPHFIELEARWNGPASVQGREQALAQVQAFGIGFGVCHSEFILTASGPVLVEINYRSIGDGREFLLDEMMGGRWFESILRLHLGERLASPARQRSHALVRYYVAQQEGRLARASADHVHESEQASARYRRLRSEDEAIRLSHSNKDYLGVLHISAADESALQHTLASMQAQLYWQIDAEAEAQA